jgi:hypothetical protein
MVLVAFSWWWKARADEQVWQVALEPWRRRATLAALLVLAYLGFVFRVGGDFMFARFLIPVTPLLLVLLELGITRVAPARTQLQWLLAGLASAGLLLTPYPLPRDARGGVRGIVFEPDYYPRERTERLKSEGLTLRPFFEGLPVSMAFYGAEARVVYYARPQTAIECATGLTDRQIARQPLKERGRIGHEKLASTDYVLSVRRTRFTFTPAADILFRLNREIPHVPIEMDGVQGLVLTWDPALMDSLRSRGAHFPDFPSALDAVLADPGRLKETRKQEWFSYDKLNRFYFAQTNDPRLESLLQQRLGESTTGAD